MAEAEPLSEASSWRKIGRRQKYLVPEQEARIRQFAQQRLAALLSGVTIDEQEAEAHLRQAYRVAGLELSAVRWFDSPLAFIKAHYLQFEPGRLRDNTLDKVHGRVERDMLSRLQKRASDRIRRNVEMCLEKHVRREWLRHLENRVRWCVSEKILYSVDDAVLKGVSSSLWRSGEDGEWNYREALARMSVWSLIHLERFALCRIFHEACQENDLIHLARFSEMVSGYRLGASEAWVVHNAIRCSFDEHERLHNEHGPCVEYRDGWQIYAWHGVLVPERVILAPESLTRQDWLRESNLGARRVIQERMPNFAEQVGGRLIDADTRGCLYAIDLGGDPEGVAHYIQVCDSSTQRIYYLRVPPSIRRANEAVAWTFGLSERDYQPQQET